MFLDFLTFFTSQHLLSRFSSV